MGERCVARVCYTPIAVSAPKTSIRFPCHCGHRFDLPVDQAGGTIQCPACGLLVDIPTLADLQSMAADGTLRIQDKAQTAAKPPPANPAAFSRSTDKDLRNTYDDIVAVGVDESELPLKLAPGVPAARRLPPKYDPVTGDLVRPIEIANPPAPGEGGPIPVARHAVGYASGENARYFSLFRIMGELFMPANMFVMLFTFAFCFAWNFLGGFLGMVLAYAGTEPKLVNIPMAFFLMAHYVNTIDETGPTHVDELPRPLRAVAWGEDIWGSFVQFSIALMISFAPAVLLGMVLPVEFRPMAWLIGAVCFLIFPAAILTAATSGTLNNLRYDRLIRTARASGWSYIASLLIWAVALPLFVFSIAGELAIPKRLRDEFDWMSWLSRPYIFLPIWGISVYFMHLACWHLGLMYRNHYEKFEWVLQRHVSTRREEELRQAREARIARNKAKYVTPPPGPG